MIDPRRALAQWDNGTPTSVERMGGTNNLSWRVETSGGQYILRLYQNEGKYEEAEPLFQRALTIREKVLGPEHPHTAQSLNNLAILYYKQGKNVEAEPLFQQAWHLPKQA